MKPDSALMQALEARHSFAHLLAFRLGSQMFYLTDSDTVIDHGGDKYVPGFVKEIGEIEQTSTPRLNEIQPQLHAIDQTFVGLFLSENWMNGPFTVSQIVWDEVGETAGLIQLFNGLMTDISIDEQNSSITVSVTSVWADFEKSSGIKTNVASQQRHYPECTGFRWGAQAGEDIPWARPGNNPPLPGNDDGGDDGINDPDEAPIRPPKWDSPNEAYP